MTESFEHDLEAALDSLAARSPLPPADLTRQVRARVTALRRRKTLLGTAGITVCASVLLGLTLALPRPPAATSPTSPATSANQPTTAASSPAGTPWWPLTDAHDTVPPAFLTSFWDAHAPGPHSGVRVLHQDMAGGQLVLLLVGRQADGQARMALVRGRRDSDGSLSSTGLTLLADLPRPADPEGPLALAFGSGTASSIKVLAPGCPGRTRLTAATGNLSVTLSQDFTGALGSPQIGSVQLPYSMTIGCDRTTTAAKGTSFQLTLQTTATVTANATVYLFSTP